MVNGTTFTRFLIEEQRGIRDATGDFTSLVNDIVTAIKEISHTVTRGNLIGVLGSAHSRNAQGEAQEKLDVIANNTILRAVEWTGLLAAIASEELEDVYPIPAAYPRENIC